MKGKDLIKLILDNNQVDSEIRIFGSDEGIIQNDLAAEIVEIGTVLDEEDNEYAAIVIDTSIG